MHVLVPRPRADGPASGGALAEPVRDAGPNSTLIPPRRHMHAPPHVRVRVRGSLHRACTTQAGATLNQITAGRPGQVLERQPPSPTPPCTTRILSPTKAAKGNHSKTPKHASDFLGVGRGKSARRL